MEDRLEKEANAPPPIPFGGPRPVGQTPLSTKTGEPHPRAAAEKRNVMEYVPGAERRIDFSAYVASLDKVEEEHKKLLTNSFEESIMALITDAKKNSTFRSA